MTASAAAAADDPIRRRRILYAVTLGILQTISTLTIDIYLPAFPQIAAEFSASQAAVQFTFTGAMIGSLFGQLLAGPLSDMVGRKTPLLAACGLHIIASLLCAVAPSAELLAAARFILGLAAAATGVIALSIVRDLYSGHAMVRMLSNMALISGVAVAVGPLLGSTLLQIMPWRLVFVTLACYGVLVALLCGAALSETLPSSARHRDGLLRRFQGLGEVFRDRTYRGLALTSAFMWGGMFSYLAASSFLFQQVFGLTPTGYGLVFATHALFMLAGNQLSGRVSRRLGFHALLLIGVTGTVASTGVMAVLQLVLPGAGIFGVLGPLWAFTFFLGLSTPSIQAAAMSRHGGVIAGAAASGVGASRQLLGAVASPLAGLVGITSGLPVAVIMFAGQAIALLMLWAFVLRSPQGSDAREGS